MLYFLLVVSIALIQFSPVTDPVITVLILASLYVLLGTLLLASLLYLLDSGCSLVLIYIGLLAMGSWFIILNMVYLYLCCCPSAGISGLSVISEWGYYNGYIDYNTEPSDKYMYFQSEADLHDSSAQMQADLWRAIKLYWLFRLYRPFSPYWFIMAYMSGLVGWPTWIWGEPWPDPTEVDRETLEDKVSSYDIKVLFLVLFLFINTRGFGNW